MGFMSNIVSGLVWLEFSIEKKALGVKMRNVGGVRCVEFLS